MDHINLNRRVMLAVVTTAFLTCTPSLYAASYQRSGLAWKVSLENKDVQALKTNGGLLSALISNPEPVVSKAIAAGIGIIDLVNEAGGRKGVDIAGVHGQPNTVITPKGRGPYAELARIGRSLSKVGEHWGGIANGNIEQASEWLASHDPGPAIAEALGVGRRKPKHLRGGMVADRKNAGGWERFTFLATTDGRIAILGHTGYLAAEGGGGGSTYADRDSIREWEKWTLIRNSDGTISLRSSDGKHYFTAERGGGSVCRSDRTRIGEWEKFRLEFGANGSVSLKTLNKGLYVSAQP